MSVRCKRFARANGCQPSAPRGAQETFRRLYRFGCDKAASAVRKTGFVGVTEYRLYGLDGVDKVASGQWIDAADDLTAIENARKMMDGHDCELWQGTRLVARLPRKRHR
jgi:hypothetical protein